MDLTRTERLILETAAEMFDFEIGAARAATMTEIELTPEERQVSNGDRPQLGELMLHRGWVSKEQLEQVLDRVYGEVQGWSDRLAAPAPVQIPRPLEDQSTDAQLAELVRQLTALLDILIGDGTGLMSLPAASVAAYASSHTVIDREEEEIGGGGFTIGGPLLGTVMEISEEDDDTKDFKKPVKAVVDEEADAMTISFERPDPAVAEGGTLQIAREEKPEPVPEGGTLQIARKEKPPEPEPASAEGTLQISRRNDVEYPTLHIQRGPDEEPAEEIPIGDGALGGAVAGSANTLQVERAADLEEDDIVSRPTTEWSPPDEDDTAQLERPEGATLHVERAGLTTTGDTVSVERAEVGNADA